MPYHDDKPTVAAGKSPVDRSADTAYAGAGANWSGRPNMRKTEVLQPQHPRTFAWLVVTTGPHAGYVFTVNPEVTTIGRDAATCDLVIDDDSMSMQHCRVKAEKPETGQGGEETREKQFYIYDLATTNGTRVNGEKILRQALQDGDRVEIGHTTLAFKEL